jgi:hypothetical protein
MTPKIPEQIQEKATPQSLVRRLAILQSDYRHGGMSAADFNRMLSVFQFKDEEGYIWSPGARTSQWYRWDGKNWQPLQPPRYLYVPNDPFTESPQWEFADVDALEDEEKQQPAAESEERCQCGGVRNEGDLFCTQCGARFQPESSASTNCPSCGNTLDESARFCSTCGASVETPATKQSAMVCGNPDCRKPIQPGAKFCTFCGTPVS